MRWAGHVANNKERIMQNFGCGNLRKRYHLGDLGVDERIIVKGTCRNMLGKCGLD